METQVYSLGNWKVVRKLKFQAPNSIAPSAVVINRKSLGEYEA